MKIFCCSGILVWAVFGFSAVIQFDDTKPSIENVGVEEHLGQNIDPELTFRDSQGREVRLGSFLERGKPVVIVPVYYSCPGLCTLILNGVSTLIDEMDLVAGEDYEIVNISFDPDNTPELAQKKAENYFRMLKKTDEARRGWHFLTGEPRSIAAAMDQVGFRYKKIDDQFSHASVLVLLSPEGKISRYLYGVRFNPRDARLALVEASQGKVGTTMDQILTFCFRFDPKAGKYVPYAWNLMRAGGVMTLLIMGLGGFLLWKK